MNHNSGPTDLFSRFWLDLTSRMTPPSWSTPQQSASTEEPMRVMRQAFFDSWAKACDEYLGSEEFMQALRRSMDDALAFRQQVNELLTKALHDAQIPSREDTDSLMLVLRSMEERVLDRLARLTRRVEQIEERLPAAKAEPPAAPPEPRHRAKGDSS